MFEEVEDRDGDSSITEVEMKAAFEYGIRTCKVVHQIHKDIASNGGCLGKNKINKDEFKKCLEKLA
jgi:hypothetical protein